MVVLKKFLLWGFLVIPLAMAQAAPAPESLTGLKKQVSEQDRALKNMGDAVKKLETQLGQGNKRYLDIVQRKDNIRTQLYELQEGQKKLAQVLQQKQDQARSLMKKQLLAGLDEDTSSAQLLTQKIILENLTKEMTEVAGLLEQNQQAQQELNTLEQRYQEFHLNEIEIATFLNEMEAQKKTIAQQYLDEKKKREDLMGRYNRVRNQINLSQARQTQRATELRFFAPIEDFGQIDYKDKGIHYTFQGSKPVVSTQAGEIVFAGELSTYGNVVMIDHGQETRSVILGDFLPKLSKGDKVAKGDVVGYTESSQSNGQIYFEVRIMNQVQNTINLMDNEVLNRSVLARR